MRLKRLPEKDPEEAWDISFNFAPRLTLTETIATVVMEASVISGVDPAPSAILTGSAAIVDGRVIQRVENGIAGVTYKIRCEATTSDDHTYILGARLPVSVV